MAFYKKEEDNIEMVPNVISGPGIFLGAASHEEYTYPTQGWYWFDTFDEAVVFFANQIDPPESITMRQARLQLYNMNVLDTIDNTISNIGGTAKIEWEYSSVVEKTNPLVSAMAQILNWDETQINQFFIDASKL